MRPARTTAGPSQGMRGRGTGTGAGAAGGGHPILALQQTLGNRATTRLLRSGLEVSRPGDASERDADRVADRVMRTRPERTCAACAAGGAPCAKCG